MSNNSFLFAEEIIMSIKEIYSTMFQNYPDVMNIAQLSKLLGVSTKLTTELLKENRIKYIKIGREYRIVKIHVLEYLDAVPEKGS